MSRRLSNFGKTFEAIPLKLHSRYPQKTFGWFVLSKNLTFRIHSVYEWKNFVLREKKLGSFLKTALCVYWSLFSNFHPVFCGFWRYQKLSERFLIWLAKASFYRSRFLLEDECFFLEKLFFCVFFVHFGKKIFTQRTWTFIQSPRTCILHVPKKGLEENFQLKRLP